MDAYLQILRQTTGLEWISEYRFHPPRRWRFDYACLGLKIAVELNGGNFVGGRHSNPVALGKEYEKMSQAAADGWAVLICTPMSRGLEVMRFGGDAFTRILAEAITNQNCGEQQDQFWSFADPYSAQQHHNLSYKYPVSNHPDRRRSVDDKLVLFRDVRR